MGEVERDKEKAKEAAAAANKTATADSVASLIETTLVLPSGVPEPHAETEEAAQGEAALLLGPLEAKIKREVSGMMNPLTGGQVALAGGVEGGERGLVFKPLPTQGLRGSGKGAETEQGQE